MHKADIPRATWYQGLGRKVAEWPARTGVAESYTPTRIPTLTRTPTSPAATEHSLRLPTWTALRVREAGTWGDVPHTGSATAPGSSQSNGHSLFFFFVSLFF